MAGMLNGTCQEITKNETSKPKASTESMMIACSSLVIMAGLPIFVGAFRSISCLQNQKESGRNQQKQKKFSRKQIIISMQDAVMFPFFASGFLIGLYAFFKLFSKQYINMLASLYFSASAVLSLTYLLRPCISNYIPENYLVHHHLVYTKGKDVQRKIINFSFRTGDMIAFALCSVLGGVYLWNRHWIVNNIFGIAVAVDIVELFYLNNITIGCTFLGTFLVYDIFWVFATDVMETVTKYLEAPNRLLFPVDLLENGVNSTHFMMLGLGDIIIPGRFIALFLRFDESLKSGKKLYFYSSLFAYLLGLVLTIVIMSYFERSQPALLYLVPPCIGIPSTVAIIKGDVNALLNYYDYPKG